jgi:hypothetical protein
MATGFQTSQMYCYCNRALLHDRSAMYDSLQPLPTVRRLILLFRAGVCGAPLDCQGLVNAPSTSRTEEFLLDILACLCVFGRRPIPFTAHGTKHTQSPRLLPSNTSSLLTLKSGHSLALARRRNHCSAVPSPPPLASAFPPVVAEDAHASKQLALAEYRS